MKKLHHSQQPSLTPQKYIDLVSNRLTNASDPLRAEKQMAYMRGQFEYCGVGAAIWYPMAKEIFIEHGMFTGEKLKIFVEGCYDQPYREILYVGIEMMQRMLPCQKASWVKVLEKCITTHSWWDSVDWLAKLAGLFFKQYPELQDEYAHRWIESENIWLHRVAIIHQLFYRENTNEKLLFEMIQRRSDSKEFFLRKACGWALRQYSKTKPDRVKWYVKNHPLSPLSKKEALRLINKA
ncbi:MAG: DNA alkylation repair protein [Saprospiraceae bacterium]